MHTPFLRYTNLDIGVRPISTPSEFICLFLLFCSNCGNINRALKNVLFTGPKTILIVWHHLWGLLFVSYLKNFCHSGQHTFRWLSQSAEKSTVESSHSANSGWSTQFGYTTPRCSEWSTTATATTQGTMCPKRWGSRSCSHIGSPAGVFDTTKCCSAAPCLQTISP